MNANQLQACTVRLGGILLIVGVAARAQRADAADHRADPHAEPPPRRGHPTARAASPPGLIRPSCSCCSSRSRWRSWCSRSSAWPGSDRSPTSAAPTATGCWAPSARRSACSSGIGIIALAVIASVLLGGRRPRRRRGIETARTEPVHRRRRRPPRRAPRRPRPRRRAGARPGRRGAGPEGRASTPTTGRIVPRVVRRRRRPRARDGAPGARARVRAVRAGPSPSSAAREHRPTCAATRSRCSSTRTAKRAFQYLVTADFLDGRRPRGRCRADAAPCTIVVRAVEGDRRAARSRRSSATRSRRPGAITVTPAARALARRRDGHGARSATTRRAPEVTAMLCAAPDAIGPALRRARARRRRSSSARTAPGATELVVEPGPVGTDAGAVLPGRRLRHLGRVRRRVRPRAGRADHVRRAARRGVRPDAARARPGDRRCSWSRSRAWLILRTDWSAVGEAAAPEIDDAEYADLDAIIAALPPEEEDELVTTR